MSWKKEMVAILRFLVADNGDTEIYCDSDLETALIISAQLIKFEVDFDQDYTTNIVTRTISPDPTEDPKDNGFIYLVCLRATCQILKSEAKVKAGRALIVKDGPSMIDTTRTYESVQKGAEQACKDYTNAKIQYQIGNARVVHAVTTPYVIENVCPYPLNIT